MNEDPTVRIPRQALGIAPARAMARASVPTLTTGSVPPKRRLRSRKIWGIPVPLIAIFAVLAVGGAAFAAIFFSGRIQTSGQVRGNPDIRFLGQSGNDLPCVIPAPGTDGGGDLTAQVTTDGRLLLNIDAYAGAVFNLYVWFGIPDSAGVPANLRIDSVDVGNPDALDATFVNSLSTSTDGTSCQNSFGTSGTAQSFSLLRTNTPPNNFLTGGSASKKISPAGAPYAFFAFAVHLQITVKDTAPAGPLTGVATGIRVVPATP